MCLAVRDSSPVLRFAAVLIYQLRRTMGVDEYNLLVHRSMQQHCAKQSKTEVRNHINALRHQTDAPPPAPGLPISFLEC